MPMCPINNHLQYVNIITYTRFFILTDELHFQYFFCYFITSRVKLATINTDTKLVNFTAFS